MMINPTKKQLEIYKIYDEEVIPWCYVNQKTGVSELRDDAPEDIKEKYKQFMESYDYISFSMQKNY